MKDARSGSRDVHNTPPGFRNVHVSCSSCYMSMCRISRKSHTNAERSRCKDLSYWIVSLSYGMFLWEMLLASSTDITENGASEACIIDKIPVVG